jgi:hypothetical protein
LCLIDWLLWASKSPSGLLFQSGGKILTAATRNKASLPHFAQRHKKIDRSAVKEKGLNS